MYNFEMTELERLLKQVVEPKSNAFLAFAWRNPRKLCRFSGELMSRQRFESRNAGIQVHIVTAILTCSIGAALWVYSQKPFDSEDIWTWKWRNSRKLNNLSLLLASPFPCSFSFLFSFFTCFLRALAWPSGPYPPDF
jgi:hypothetical protein